MICCGLCQLALVRRVLFDLMACAEADAEAAEGRVTLGEVQLLVVSFLAGRAALEHGMGGDARRRAGGGRMALNGVGTMRRSRRLGEGAGREQGKAGG